MNTQLNKPQIKVLVAMAEMGKDDEEIGNILNVAPDTAAKYRKGFCPGAVPVDDTPAPKKAPAKKTAAKKAPSKRKR